MTTLVFLLPPRDPSRQPPDGQLGPMPFVLFSDTGQELRSGHATLALMPKARRHTVLLAARDVVLLRSRVPALKGMRLRQVLPNLIEEQLVSDPARSHVAVAPAAGADGERTIAVVDRAWMQFLMDRLRAEQRSRIRVVSCLSCLPPVKSGEAAVTLVGQSTPRAGEAGSVFEIALQDESSVCGVSVPSAVLDETVRQFAASRTLVLRRLANPAAQLELPAPLAASALDLRTETLEFSALARRALAVDLDLCQFDFAAQSWQDGRELLKRWRVPLALALACAIVCIVALNLDWLLLARQRDDLSSQANALFLRSFPKTTAVLDAPLQMRRELDALRARAGASDASDFLVLCDRVSRSLGPLGPNAVASVDYADHALTLGFAPGVSADPDWPGRLAQAGLRAEPSGAKFIIRSRT